MLKRIFQLAGFAVLLAIVWTESHELFLSYFVFSSMLLFPVFYFLEDENLWFAGSAGSIVVLLYFFYFFQHPSVEMVLFGILQGVLAGFFFIYRYGWNGLLQVETAESKVASDQLNALRQKHQSRLESLHHLEKQVAGLLELFEIARDFNDCLSLEAIASLLRERVMPELPFKQMLLVFLDTKSEGAPIARVLCINERGVQDAPGEEILTATDQSRIKAVRQSAKLVQDEGSLNFPILVDNIVSALLLVEGTHADDLAKFEVLVAYLALHIKKVRLYEAVRELSIQDGLTGVFVRRHFLERLDEELKRSFKHELPLAVLILDIDHFKRYNDTHGHLAGDATLKQVASLLRQNLRRVDIVARYGGEEFVVVTPETKKMEASEVAERIRSNIARYNFKVYNDQTRVTVSVGVSLFPDDVPESIPKTDFAAIATELIQRADQALYRAKEEGRNRVVFYQELQGG